MRAGTVLLCAGEGVVGSVGCAYAGAASDSSNASTNKFCARNSERNNAISMPQSISDLGYASTEREVRLPDLDERFVTDEVLGSMFTASGERLFSHGLNR